MHLKIVTIPQCIASITCYHCKYAWKKCESVNVHSEVDDDLKYIIYYITIPQCIASITFYHCKYAWKKWESVNVHSEVDDGLKG